MTILPSLSSPIAGAPWGDQDKKAVVRGTGIRVQTVVVAAVQWAMTPAQVTAEYDLTKAQVEQSLAFYGAHCDEIEAALEAERALEPDSE